jgi:uncharacterized protein HemX
MIGLDAIGGAIAAIGALATGAWAWWLKNQKDRATTKAEVAGADADRKVADAEGTVYRLLNERLTTLEGEVRQLRGELATERAHSRKLELHIWRLENLMRKAGIEPPPFLDSDSSPGGTA